jgi:hypothetical protein
VAISLNATLHSRIFQVSFTDAERSDSEDCPIAQPSHLDMVLLWVESCYSGKAVTEDCLDEGKLPSELSIARV